MCVSSLECFTKAASSTRCHTVWPIRETHGACACCLHVRVCVRLSFQVDSGGPFSSFLVSSISYYRPLVSPLLSSSLLLFLVSPFILPSLPSPLEFRVCPSGTSPPSSLPRSRPGRDTGVKANTSRGETVGEMEGRRERCQRYNE